MDQYILDVLLTPARAAGDLVTKGWYAWNFRTIRELVEDPDYLPEQPEPDEPVLEVVIGDAVIQDTSLGPATPAFVRVSMDRENVGETSLAQGSGAAAAWNERFLLLPRASTSMRFDVIDSGERLRGTCTMGTQSLWGSATRSGTISLGLPLTVGGAPSGTLRVHAREWDKLPLPDRPWWEPEPEDAGKMLGTAPGGRSALPAEGALGGKTEQQRAGAFPGGPGSFPGAGPFPGELGETAENPPDLFSMIDKDSTGFITRDELQAAIQKGQLQVSPVIKSQSTASLTLPITSRDGGRLVKTVEGKSVKTVEGPTVMSSFRAEGGPPLSASLRSVKTTSQPETPVRQGTARVPSPQRITSSMHAKVQGSEAPMGEAPLGPAVSRSGGAQGVLQAKSAQPIQQSRVRKKNSVPGLAEALDEGPLKPATMPVKWEAQPENERAQQSLPARLKGAGFKV